MDERTVKEIAFKAHEGQMRKDGVTSYTCHCADVAARVDGGNAYYAAWLHDVLEDTNWTGDDLREAGVSDEVVEIVKLLTRESYESYQDYIERIAADPVARQVKRADLISNLADDPNRKQLIRYADALKRLIEIEIEKDNL